MVCTYKYQTAGCLVAINYHLQLLHFSKTSTGFVLWNSLMYQTGHNAYENNPLHGIYTIYVTIASSQQFIYTFYKVKTF